MKRLLSSFLATLMALSALILVPASAISPVTVTVPVIEVEAGTKYVNIPVTISDIPSVGLSSCSFNLKAEGLTVTNIDSMLDSISPIGPIGDSDKNGATFMWNDFRSGLRETTEVCVYTVRIPSTAKGGDEFPVIITPDGKAESFSSVDTDPSSGKRYALGASAVNGKIVIVGGESEYPPVTVKAPSLEVEAGTKTVSVPITIMGITELGLSSFKFNTMIDGFAVADAAFGPLPGEPRLEAFDLSATRGVDIVWIAPANDGIFEGTTVVTYTFEIPKSARAGDVYPIVVTPSSDPENFLSINWAESSKDPVALGATGVNGQIKITGDPNVHEDPSPVTIKAPTIHVNKNTKSVDIPVIISDVPREGLSGCFFNLLTEGFEITAISANPDIGGEIVCGTLADSASKGATFKWSDPNGIRKTTEICTYTVSIPDSAKAGDVFDIVITSGEDPADFPSADTNPETGTRYNLGALCVNGRIVVDEPHEYDGPPIVFKAPVIDVYENTATVDVPITVTNIPEIGLRSGKFKTVIEGLTFTASTVGDAIYGKGNCEMDSLDNSASEGVGMVWVNDRRYAIYSDTTVVTYTVAIPENARPGDEYPIVLIPDGDRENFLGGDEDASTILASAVNGKIVIRSHEHELVEVSKKDANCTQDGNISCYHCSVCKKYFSDKNAQNEIPESQAIIPALGHRWGEWTETSPATCQKTGAAMRRCLNDGTHTETKVLPVSNHRLTHSERKDPSCEQSGTMEYWHCEDCLKYFATLESVTYPENPKTNGEVVVKTPSYRVAPGTTTLDIPIFLSGIGEKGLMSCYFRVEIIGGAVITAAKTNSSLAGFNVISPIETDENKSVSGLIWATEDKNSIYEEIIALTLTVSLPADATAGDEFKITVKPSKDVNDFVSGSIDEPGIGAVGVSGNIVIMGKTELSLSETILPALGHSLEFVEAKEATTDSDGNIAHYRCVRCGKLYADAEGKKELTPDAVIVKYGIRGDANGDGKVNTKDVIITMKYMLAPTKPPKGFVFSAADVDASGKINSKDVIAIMKIILRKK